MTDQPLRSVRLSELVAILSLVSDLGMGRPTERVLRQTMIAMRLREAAGLPDRLCADVYYTSLLTWVGCATDTSELAELFGDEHQLYAETPSEDLGGLSLAVFVAQRLGRGGSAARRAAMVGKFVGTAGKSVQQVMTNHCQAASELADRLALGEGVRRPLLQAFERWDGRGVPGKARAVDLEPAIRLVHLADVVETFYRRGGPAAAVEVARQRRGSQFDPELVDCLRDNVESVFDGLDELGAWAEVIELDPTLGRVLEDAELETALEALADFADLKSPSRIGHSRGVATLCEGAARLLGTPEPDVVMLRRAALVHDLGMIGVPSGVWEATRKWTDAQRERARTHPYLTERMLARSPGLAELGRVAALHHERLDGTGYPHGLRGDDISFPARILAAADVYHALGQPRPHRPPLDPTATEQLMRADVRQGRLDGDAVQLVLNAAGHRVRRRVELPGGLTPREAEVLVLVARGCSNPEIATELTISRKTVSHHLEHIYTRIGVTSRTEAALYAMRHRLVG